MTTLEKVGGVITLVVFAFTVGVGWNTLANRIEQVDAKLADVQRTLGSTSCTAILSRQIEAIEKGRTEARTALERLSAQYRCIPQDPSIAAFTEYGENVSAASVELENQLYKVDVLLNEQD